MGQRAAPFRVKWKRGWGYVHFSHEKCVYREALFTQDKREAEKAAARTYAEVVSGLRQRVVKRQPGRLLDLPDLLDMWIESKVSSLDPATVPTLEIYARRFVDFFQSVDRITEATASTYGLARLGQALRTTVLRELAYLRQFGEWCKLHGYLAQVFVVPKLPPKAKGTRTGTQRAKSVFVSPDEAAQIIAALPEESKTIDGRKWPLRLRFEFMWETALRPETLSRLTVPDNWRPGASHLELADEDDKARFGREVDLSPRAIAILRQVATKAGPIFGRHNYTKAIKAAAKAVLGPLRGRSFAPYDFRHGRAKALLDGGAPIRGLAFLVGHKRVSTTDKYLAPDRAAGAEALRLGTRKRAPGSHPHRTRKG